MTTALWLVWWGLMKLTIPRWLSQAGSHQQWRIQDFSGGGQLERGWGCVANLLLLPANEVWGKVMFLLTSVILSTGGGGLCRGRSPWQRPTWTETPVQRSPWTETPMHRDLPDRDPPPYSKEREVRILLECILVWHTFCWKLHENEKKWNVSPSARSANDRLSFCQISQSRRKFPETFTLPTTIVKRTAPWSHCLIHKDWKSSEYFNTRPLVNDE